VVGTRLPILPYPYLREGQRVRITGGPLVDVEGILVRGNPNKGLLVISVDLLRRRAAVQIDYTLEEAATTQRCRYVGHSLGSPPIDGLFDLPQLVGRTSELFTPGAE